MDDNRLTRDLKTLARLTNRRDILRMLGGVSLIPLIGCASNAATGGALDSGATDAGTTPGGDGATSGTCSTAIPEETGGPYPGDGTNGPNALASSDITRSDITTSFGTLAGTAVGIPLTIELTLVNVKANCAALGGYAIYLWHCDRDGNYSLYTVQAQNYLRGVQETDANGKVTFKSIFPAAYSGRWPHIHFEIFSSLGDALAAGTRVKTSQLALPQEACDLVYATAGYEKSVTNMKQTTLASDNVFSDGSSLQVATTTGNVTDGFAAKLSVGVSV
jgi:protocatechuate 3,4-dioxygenase beta subunit